MANRSVLNSLNTMKDRYPGYLGKVFSVEIDSSNPRKAAGQICTAWYQSLVKGAVNAPDIILDTTMRGKGAEIVQIVTAGLGMPTISTQYGQEGDLKNWKNLNRDQRKFLIQINPPTDLIPGVIRQLAIKMNIR